MATLAGAALLVLLVVVVEPLRSGLGDAGRGDTASLRENLRGLGAGGALILFALALAHTVIWYPAEILDAAAGFVYGFWVSLPLLMAAWLTSGIVCYLVGRHAARPFLVRWLGEERLSAYELAVRRGGATLLLGVRLVPIVPFSLLSYAAGSARVPIGRFVWTTALGYLPITAMFAYLGSRLEELSLDDPLLWLGGAVLVVLLALTRRVARHAILGSKAGVGEADSR
ncbi:MAG: TVP38/TMEM64 family protein [Solirubrobacterales bacterium]